MMNVTRSIDRGYRRVLAAVNQRGAVVRVGVMGPKGEAPKQGGKTTATNAEVASYLHEGTEHMPPRPFITIWFDENASQNRAFARLLAARRIAGKLDYRRSLELMGVMAQGGIQKRIASGPFAALAASTLAATAPKTKPLINTGQLRSSITYEIVDGGPS
jgi:hypothetical protein